MYLVTNLCLNAVEIAHDHKVEVKIEDEGGHLSLPKPVKGLPFRALTLRGPSRVPLLLPFGCLRIDGRAEKVASETGNDLQVVSPDEEEDEEAQEDEKEKQQDEEKEEECALISRKLPWAAAAVVIATLVVPPLTRRFLARVTKIVR